MKYEKWRFFLQVLILVALLYSTIQNVVTFRVMMKTIRSLENRVLMLELAHARATEYQLEAP